MREYRMTKSHPERSTHQLRVAVVGPCASGKSTLVQNLRQRGYDAYVVAQEHSAVPTLWSHQHPDLLIALQTDLKTIRQRRGPTWSSAIYKAQLQRLQDAYGSADLTIDTGVVPEQNALEQAVAFLERILAARFRN